MKHLLKKYKTLPQRTVSVLCSCAIFTVMFLTVLTGAVIFSSADNQSALGALNHEVPVQAINMMPVEIVDGGITYTDEDGKSVSGADSRTTYSSTTSPFANEYLSVVENDDTSVSYKIVKEKAASANDTTYVFTNTAVEQKINLAENPYFMVGFESYSARANGFIDFSVTKDGKTYYVNTTKGTISETETAYGFDFYRIVKGVYTQDNDLSANDFAFGSMADYNVDFYQYLYGYFSERGWLSEYWPNWGEDDNYLTVHNVRHVVISEKVNTPLKVNTSIKWKICALGRYTLSSSDTLTPREDEIVKNVIIANGKEYEDPNGRQARLDDGAMVFRNGSKTDTTVFTWDVKRYVNIVELGELFFDAEYTGSTVPFSMEIALTGRNYTITNNTTQYSAKGFWIKAYDGVDGFDYMISHYSDRSESGVPEKYRELTIDFASAIDDFRIKAGEAETFYPDDNLICIREIKLTLPAGAKLSINSFHVEVENEFAAATTENTVYPWSVSEDPESLPPEGTPATTANLDYDSGAYSSAYNWIATATPTVQSKVDLLALTDQHVIYSDGIYSGTEADGVTGYWRTLDGDSYFTSNTTDMVYRSFKRRSKEDTGASGTADNNNYYMYININTTPYLYFSYEMSGGEDAAAGLYFKFDSAGVVTDNNGAAKEYKQFYLGQSGLALKACDNIMSSADETAAEAHRALCSSATARTGVIDLTKYFRTKDSNGNYTVVMDEVLFEELRFYLTGENTKLHFNYLFLGSETLADTAKSTIAKNSGDAFPWAVKHDTFKTATIGTNSQFTFANRVDILADMDDRAGWHVDCAESPQYSSVAAWYGGESRYTKEETDGALTVKVGETEDYVHVGRGFDHVMKINLGTDLSSLRYLNYSVEAPAGMRWSIIIREDIQNNNDAGTVVRTWTDAVVHKESTGGTEFILDKSETYAASYFRELDSDSVFNTYWYNGEQQTIASARDDAWSVFTVPGSETGCFDLTQVSKDFYANSQLHMNWDKVLSIYLVAYKDPSIMDETGTKDVAGSVTFNYLYLTSEPLTGSSYGTAPVADNTSYSWPYDNSLGNITWKGNYIRSFSNTNGAPEYPDWSGAADFYYYSNGARTAVTINDNYSEWYSLYYSFDFTDKNGNPAYPPMTVVLYDSSGNYLYRLRTSNSFAYCTPTLLSGSTRSYDDFEGHYKMLTPESGAICVDQITLTNLYRIRVFFDTTKYNISLDYAVLANKASYQAPTQTKSLTALASKEADFSAYPYVLDKGIQTVIHGDGSGRPYSEFTSTQNHERNIVVDLNRTPYLYYSIEYAAGSNGTFALSTTTPIGDTTGFFRNGAVSAIGSKALLSVGVSPSASNYMLTSETGCINVKEWYETHNTLPSDGKITIDRIYIFLNGSYARYHYLYFAGTADKTLDLIPKVAGGDLESGVSTHAWSYQHTGDERCGEMGPSSDTECDMYLSGTLYKNGSASSETPTLKAKYAGDANADGYNDLTYSSDNWGFHSVCYGEVEFNNNKSFSHVSTGNNQMSGLTINLNETPYLHFSISQEEGSYTTFLLQTNDYTSRDIVRIQSADKVCPWLSCYNSLSPAGQLMNISPQTQFITFYKDTTMTYTNGTYNSGELAGVIDLRSWYTETNGYGDIISLERVRFYCTNYLGSATDVTVNHFYLSSSSGAAYSVTFDKNDNGDESETTTLQILKNANEQYVSDDVVESYKTREGYTFVGWYTDREWESYFDIENDPITENVTLYAGWIKDSEVVENELNILAGAANTADGIVTVDDTAVHINNTTSAPYEYSITVNKPYSVNNMPALYIGFDTNVTSKGASIVLDLKSLGSHNYDILGKAFGENFLTNGLLSAAPYNEEMSMYTRLATDNLLPVKENTEGYVYAKTVTITVPAGVAMHLRYFSAAKSMEASSATVVAPSISGTVLDMLDPDDDSGFVEQLRNTSYTLLKDATEVFNTENTLCATHISGVDTGYATLGSLYGLGDPIGSFTMDANNHQYLYFHITQPEESRTTFNIWCTVYYSGTDANGETVTNKGAHPPKWSSFYDDSTGGLGSQDDMDNGSIPQRAYAYGTVSGCIDLYEWYSDAMKDQGITNLVINSIQINGIRLYTTNSGTDATFNYIAVGGKAENNSVSASVTYPTSETATAATTLEDVQAGQTVHLSLNDLTACPNAFDPSIVFKGWSFTSASSEPVWWNPTPTNHKQYSASNTGGAWSTTYVEGFVQDRADVQYQLIPDTAMIYPVFGEAYQPQLTVNFDGSGKVAVLYNDLQTTADATSTASYTCNYADEVVLSATASDFAGWYENGVLVSASRDYRITMVEDTVITAKFGAAQIFAPHAWPENQSVIVWLQSEDVSLTAGDDFFVRSVNSGDTAQHMISYSNIDDLNGATEIVCYWELEQGQMLEAVAPEGYHFEQLQKDGSMVRVSEQEIYSFVAAVDIQLVCVADTAAASDTAIISNEYAVEFSRDDRKATITGQIVCAQGEDIISCGIIIAQRPAGVTEPCYRSAEAVTISASAWNSTTGQFTVTTPYPVAYRAYYGRTYAILRDANGQYRIQYGDIVIKSF